MADKGSKVTDVVGEVGAAPKPKVRTIWTILSESKAHSYSNRRRAVKVYERAVRMGVKVEFIPTVLRGGDPYRSVSIQDVWEKESNCE